MTSMLVVPPAAFAAKPPKVWVPPNTQLQETKSVSGHDEVLKSVPADSGRADGKPAPRRAPKSGSATVAVGDVSQEQLAARKLNGGAAPAAGGDARIKAGDLPVFLTDRAQGKASSADAPSVKVDVLDEGKSKATGRTGPVIALTGANGSATPGHPLSVSLDLKDLIGDGAWTDRARLVRLPECALTTPDKPECAKSTLVASSLDARTGTLTADLELPAAADKSGAVKANATGSGSVVQAGFVEQAAASSGTMVLAAEASPSGSMGSYAATPISPSAAWSAGTNAGNFTYSYTIAAPTAIGGAAPSVVLTYDSSAVDGRTAANNAQPSWIGDGWDYTPGSISRSYKPCAKSGIDMSGDECWAGQALQLNLAGHSGTVVKDDTTGELRLQGDDGTQITPLTGLANGAWNGEGFKVTTTDGTQYYFGANHLPGGDGTDPAANSVNTVPVYHPHAGDPCYNSSTGLASWCQMGWQWNLDFVVDLHGNLIKYKYAKESNYYSRGGGQNNGTGTLTAYDRNSYITDIHYGVRLSDQIAIKGAGNPAEKVVFTVKERCWPGATTCTSAEMTAANQASWPDTPLDQLCASTGPCTNYGPSFWTSKMLSQIDTKVYVGGNPRTVDTWTLTQSQWDPSDGTAKLVWLSSIKRAGSNGQGTLNVPAVSFTASPLPNRVDGLVPPVPQFNRPRMKEIRTETGGRITVTYKDAECSRAAGRMPASAQTNTLACMPVKWVPPNSPSTAKPYDDWFHKYLVSSVIEESMVTASSAAKLTEYSYGGGAAWHRNDSEFADDDTRTWDNFRGYQTVTTTTGSGSDGPKTKNVTTFLRGMGGQVTDSWGGTITDSDELAGFVRETQNYDSAAAGAKVMGGELTTPWISDVTATHTQPNGLPKVYARYVNTAQVKARSLLSNGSWRVTERNATYDKDHAGRVVTTDVLGDTSLANLPQRQCTAISYASGGNSVMVETPYRVLTLAGACGQTPTQANTIADTLTIYDGQALGTIGAEANQTESRVLESYGAGNTPNYRATAKAQYDTYGRQTATTDPNRIDATHPGGATTTTVYTPATGAIPTTIEVTNPLGWKSTTTMDPGRGLPTKAVDENGRTTIEAYDALGRLTGVWLPGHDPAATDLSKNANRVFSYALNGVNGPSTVTSKSLHNDGVTYANSIEIYDGLGRIRQAQSVPVANTTGRLISESVFDSHGWQVQTTPSYYNKDSGPTSAVYLPVADSEIAAQTWTEYDGLGRPTVSKFVSYAQEQWRTTTTYVGADRIDSTPPTGGFASTTIVDATGATVETRQYKSNTPTGAYDATTYGYDIAGKPTWRQDSSNPPHRWTYSYDLLGQQTSGTDPDSGASTVAYDKSGNVVTATDARGKATSFSYDLLGRKTGQYDGTSNTDASKLTTAWTYDSKALGKPDGSTRYVDNPAGGAKLAYKQSVTGYDLGYRPTGSSVTIPSVAGETELAGTYTWSMTYSGALNLLKSVQMPALGGLAAETVGSSYDNDGNFTGSSGLDYYVQDMQYDNFGRPLRTTIGASGMQVVSTQGIDPATGRIVQSTLDKQTATTTHVDLTDYTFNKVGSLTSVKTVQDGVNTDLQCFTYDYLGRLTAAWTDKGTTTTAAAPSVPGIGGCTNSTEPTTATASARIGGPAPYWQSYGYDLTGNRAKLVQHDTAGTATKDKTVDQTFATGPNTPSTDPATGGGTGGPHALLTSKTTINGTSTVATSTYDANGNTTSITDTAGTKTLTWDNQGKLAKVHDTGATGDTSYVYDASGNQFIRRSPGKVTINLGSDELTLNTATHALSNTRYYSAPGGLTVTRTTATGGGKLYYQAADPHGTGGVQMEAATLNSVRRPTDPFGNARGTQPGNGVWAGDKGFVGGTIEGTGFTNLGARQYDPRTGRFLSVDPIFNGGDPQSWNGYAYANNDPINGSDPNGTCRVAFDDNICQGIAPIYVDHGSTTGQSGSSGTNSADNSKSEATNQALQKKNEADAALAKAKREREELITKIVDVVGDLIGFNDARDCFTKGDVMGCINTALNFVPWAKALKAVKIGIKAFKLWREGEKAYDAMRSAQRIAKEAEDALNIARKTEREAAEAENAATKADAGPTPEAKPDAPGSKPAAEEPASSSGGSCTFPRKANSFPAGTLVQLADGSTEAIDKLEIGDEVLATDPQTGVTRSEPVIATIITPNDTEFTDLALTGQAGTSAVTSTAHHPYWDETVRKWVDAADVKVGDQLRTINDALVTVTATRSYLTPPTTAHNLTVASLHTYYVLAGTTPVLVHNCGDPTDELLDHADAHIGKTNVAAEVVATDGTRAFGISRARSLEELTPNVRTAVQATGHHGGCAEIGALCKLESGGAPITGARGQAVHVMGGTQDHPADLHGENLPFCQSCRNLFEYLEGGPLHG
ncbi:polymorphic toxin-type HINT domain-containing protein [Kitasatospora griseola]|uniref:polymorphic toxin-type HINT domain-containing protein n=1 Tax=Kitasatospora griseola TaxID=2064 RepID=UPI002285CEF1|nr:polymorphic toxin-type HINT domain-containing protein [Kitasatospora griseola]